MISGKLYKPVGVTKYKYYSSEEEISKEENIFSWQIKNLFDILLSKETNKILLLLELAEFEKENCEFVKIKFLLNNMVGWLVVEKNFFSRKRLHQNRTLTPCLLQCRVTS